MGWGSVSLHIYLPLSDFSPSAFLLSMPMTKMKFLRKEGCGRGVRVGSWVRECTLGDEKGEMHLRDGGRVSEGCSVSCLSTRLAEEGYEWACSLQVARWVSRTQQTFGIPRICCMYHVTFSWLISSACLQLEVVDVSGETAAWQNTHLSSQPQPTIYYFKWNREIERSWMKTWKGGVGGWQIPRIVASVPDSNIKPQGPSDDNNPMKGASDRLSSSAALKIIP